MGARVSKSIYTDKHMDTAAMAAVTACSVAAISQAKSSNNLVPLLSSGQLAVQLWVGFVASPTMRHHFERDDLIGIQNKLFPKYGLLLTSASIIALSASHFGGGVNDLKSMALVANLVLNGLNMLWFFPKSIQCLNKEKTDESNKELWHRKFRMLHGCSMLANLSSMVLNLTLCLV